MTIHEECGVFGITSPKTTNLARITYYGLYALQHRGQESCGIVVNQRGIFSSHKDLGLVGDVFSSKTLEALPEARIAIGHTRYGTTGRTIRSNCQPIEVNHQKGHMAIAHNGNLTNAAELRNKLELGGAIFHTTSDTEIIAYIITRERLRSSSIEEALSRTMDIIEGAYSIVLMSPQKMLCARDPCGFRPLCYGRTADGMNVIASESCALKAVNADFIRDIKAGEIMVFNNEKVFSDETHCDKEKRSLCCFEYIYFARPDSIIDGVSVHSFRVKAGETLAAEHPVDADIVIGAPDSGLDAALGFSRASGIPYGTGLIKNKYIGRTFISPSQDERVESIAIKLSAVESIISGKKVVLVDDSIVRGNTMAQVVKMLRDAGAKEVHVRISSPPFLHPCFYGTDIDSDKNLIARNHDVNEISNIIGADTLGYLPLEAISSITAQIRHIAADSSELCHACFSGNYPTSIPAYGKKNRFEQAL